MTTLCQNELYLVKPAPDDEEMEFLFRSRAMCCYLERRLVKLKFETLCSRININCAQSVREVSVKPYEHEPYLEVNLPYLMPPLDSLDSESLQQHYSKIIEMGLEASESFMPVPFQFCVDVLRQFERIGYVNEWVQAEKSWKKNSIRSVITAHLTMDEFFLTQRVEHGGKQIEERIARTKTREVLFTPFLGDLSMDDSGILVYKNKKRIISEYSLVQDSFIKTSL